MRVRTFINRVVWLVVLAYAGYAVIAAGSSYLQVRSLVDQAVDEASKRVRTTAAPTQPGAALQEFAADTRTALLLGARRVGFDLPPQKLLIESRGLTGEYESGSTVATSCGPWPTRRFSLSRSGSTGPTR